MTPRRFLSSSLIASAGKPYSFGRAGKKRWAPLVRGRPLFAAGLGRHETAAVQNSLDACYTAGGCDVYWPRGTYNVEGPLRPETNSILRFPDNPHPQATYSVRWRGETVPRLQDHEAISPAWTMIVSRRRRGAGAFPALIAARSYRNTAASLYEFNFVNPVMENLYVRTAPNPTLTMFQFHEAANATLRNVMLDTGSAATFGRVAEPTHSQAAAVVLPGQNNRSRIRVEDTSVSGFYEGIRFSELAHFGGQVFVAYARDAYVRENAFHPSYGHVFAAEARRGLVVLGSAVFGDMTIDSEVYNPGGPEWFAASKTDYFSDPGSAATGRIKYTYVIAGPGVYGAPSKNGMNNVSLCNLVTGQCQRGTTTFNF